STPPPPPTPPVANDDVYSSISGVPLVVPTAQGVMANDVSVNGTVTVVSGPAEGDLTLNPDGSFAYTTASAAASDSFVYQLQDANGTDQATVTINLTARALFVREGASGAGTLDDPRGDLDGALADALPGETVFVLFSPNPLISATDLTVPAGVALIGEASGLMNGMTVIVPPGPRPEIRTTLIMEDGTKAAGFLSSWASGPPNLDLDGADTVTIDNLQIQSGGGGDQITFSETTGTLTVRDSQFSLGNALNGGLTSGSLALIVEGNDFGDADLFLTVDGAAASADLNFSDNSMRGRLDTTTSNAAHLDLLIEDSDFGSTAFLDLNQATGGTASTEIDGNTFQSAQVVRLDDIGGAGGEFSLTNNSFDQSTQTSVVANLRGGVYEVVVIGNTITNTQGSVNQDIDIVASDGGSGLVRIEDNETARGIWVLIVNGGNIGAGLLNNRVGKDPGGAGTGRRQLRVDANAGAAGDSLCARIAGNDVGVTGIGGTIVLDNSGGSAATLNVESLSTLAAENTTATPINSAGTIGDVPLGTCAFP
ncbi:MAG: hypothetical protein HY319_32830, partial [Armatimonadetes bacterium]|nr:hypothetical protein [Armatimonadota bacterium]